MARGVERAIAQAAGFLQSVQLSTGGFTSFSSPTKAPFRESAAYQTTFAPALILAALSTLEDPTIAPIRTKLATWLLAQKSPNWAFNYWAVNAPQRTTLPYPDDLDDTACALIALYSHDRSLITQDCLAHIVKLLIATESQVGGPYRTWIVSATAPQTWQDIDLAVNSNVACFLSFVAQPLPNLTALMDRAITAGAFRSPYYPSPYPITYFLARAYHGAQSDALAKYLVKRRRAGWWGSPLRTALAVSALAQLGQADTCKIATQHLLDAQQPDGSWAAEAFCLDPALAGKTHYNGSAALTTAFALEALARCDTSTPPANLKQAQRDGQATALQANIIKLALQEVGTLDTDLRKRAQHTVLRTEQADKHNEITLLPYFFKNSLAGSPKLPLTPLTDLGLANLFGWAAYTIYDDFLDDEGVPALLSVANTCLRNSLRHFRRALPAHAQFQQLVDETFDKIDGANAWELAHCRFAITKKGITLKTPPNYGNRMRLAERSLGHTLTPLGVLAATGIQVAGPQAQAIRQALKHYLIARQLNDDLHDWEQDLRAGHISYAVAAILQQLSLAPGTYSFKKLLPRMQTQFWHHTLIDVCKTATHHTAQARTLAKTSRLLIPQHILLKLVDPIDASIHRTLREQHKAQQFLAAYKSGDD